MVNGFSVTYERWTYEDAEADETDDRGFVVQGVSLRDAIRVGLEYARPEWCSFSEPNDSRLEHMRWLDFHTWNEGCREQIEKGITEGRALHIPDYVSPSSRVRIAKLFGAYGTERNAIDSHHCREYIRAGQSCPLFFGRVLCR